MDDRRRTPAWIPQLLAVLVAAAAVAATAWWSGPTTTVTTAGDHDLRNGRIFLQDNLWSTGDAQYAVWVDGDGDPVLGRRALGGTWVTVDLAAVDGNPLAAPTKVDLHNVYVVAADPVGHVHVMGNMHGQPLRYIRTARPGRFDRWVEPVVGGPLDQVTYPMVAALPDGTLLFFRRDGTSSDGDIHLDRLRAGATDWEYLGAVLAGRHVPEGMYLHHVAVDPVDGTVHLVVVWRSGPTVDHQRDVSYLRSGDGGTTWTDSTGRPYRLPVTHDDVEIVLGTDPVGSGLRNGGGLVVDDQGRPHAVISDRNGLHHVWHDDTGWRIGRLPDGLGSRRPSVARGADGSVWMIGVAGNRLAHRRIHPDVGPLETGPELPARFEPVYDTQAMQLTGAVQVLTIERGDTTPTVVELDVGGD